MLGLTFAFPEVWGQGREGYDETITEYGVKTQVVVRKIAFIRKQCKGAYYI